MTGQLDWKGGLQFGGSVGDVAVLIDGDSKAAPSPVQMLSAAVAGCMAIDIVHILERMRTPPQTLSIDLEVERAPRDPRRVTTLIMTFSIGGDVPQKNVARAIELSRETYCSVLHSLRDDISIETPFRMDAVALD